MSWFVLRYHKADRAGEHYDLHLQEDSDTYRSWALRKGMPSHARHLAVETLPHTGEEARTEGTIDAEYGKGTTHVVDEGPCTFLKNSPHHIHFVLEGNIYKGRYHLRHWEGKKWLIWKEQNNV